MCTITTEVGQDQGFLISNRGCCVQVIRVLRRRSPSLARRLRPAFQWDTYATTIRTARTDTMRTQKSAQPVSMHQVPNRIIRPHIYSSTIGKQMVLSPSDNYLALRHFLMKPRTTTLKFQRRFRPLILISKQECFAR